MELFKGTIAKEQLLSIPKSEQTFFILLTHLSNALFTLQKLTVFCAASKKESNEIVRRARNSQALLMTRLTAGYLWEGWLLLQTNYFGSCLSKEYGKVLSTDAKSSLDYLKRYFNGESKIEEIRHLAFHLLQKSPEEISKAIDNLEDKEQMSLYFSKHAGLCFYELSDTIINNTVLSLVKGDTVLGRLENLEKEVREVVKKYLLFVNEFVLQFGKKYLLELNYESIQLPEPPAIDDVVIPYFLPELEQV